MRRSFNATQWKRKKLQHKQRHVLSQPNSNFSIKKNRKRKKNYLLHLEICSWNRRIYINRYKYFRNDNMQFQKWKKKPLNKQLGSDTTKVFIFVHAHMSKSLCIKENSHISRLFSVSTKLCLVHFNGSLENWIPQCAFFARVFTLFCYILLLYEQKQFFLTKIDNTNCSPNGNCLIHKRRFESSKLPSNFPFVTPVIVRIIIYFHPNFRFRIGVFNVLIRCEIDFGFTSDLFGWFGAS